MQYGRGKWSVRVVIAAVVVVAGVAAFVAVRDSDSDPETQGAGDVPSDILSGTGTQLPDEMEVAPGSALIGAVKVEALDASDEPERWSAVLLVDGDPIEVWTAYAEQIAALFPDDQIDASQAPGCQAHSEDRYEVCSLGADTVTGTDWKTASARLISVAGDITGSYLLVLSMYTSHESSGMDIYDGADLTPWSGSALPEPQPARTPPKTGEPLAPHTVAYEDDSERYVLLPDSRLITQYGDGSITGGFDVLLRVAAGADLDAVADKYAEQANQFEGEPVDAPTEFRYQDMTIKVYQPPGGAGGYSATINTVATPDGDGLIFYELAND